MSKKVKPAEQHVTLKGYITGFVSSVIVTLMAYTIVVNHSQTRDVMIGIVASLAVIQFVLQAVYFLHLGTERKPRWKLGVFLFMLLVVLIVVVGSIWIMNNLNYHHVLTPDAVNRYLDSQDGL